jgi:hypothetical protein
MLGPADCAGSPLGVFEQDPRTKQSVLATALKGGLPLATPLPGAAAAAGAVATVFNRNKKGASQSAFCYAPVCVSADGAQHLLQTQKYCQGRHVKSCAACGACQRGLGLSLGACTWAGSCIADCACAWRAQAPKQAWQTRWR